MMMNAFLCFNFMLVVLRIHCECAAGDAAAAAASHAASSSSSSSISSPSSSSSPAAPAVHSSLGFELIHRDAPGSVIRGAEAQCTGLPPESMPMRDFVAAGRGVRSRQPIVGGQVSYEGQRRGDFYLTMAVGSPAQRLLFLMDTGSELTWAQCKPCEVCIDTGSAPSFTVARSSTYKRVSCTSALCRHSVGFSGAGCGLDANASSPSSSSSSPSSSSSSSSQSASSSPSSSSDSSSCSFRISYADGSGNEGFLSVDVFHLVGKHLVGRLVFGCSVKTVDPVSGESVKGLIGLSAGPFSFPSQLQALLSGPAAKWPHKFAYCLPDRRHLARKGAILFGNYSLPATVSQAMLYTPLLSPFAPLGKLYYYVGLRAISVGRSVLPIDSSVLLPDSDGGGGTILDSGSALTFLFTPAYKPLIEALRRATLHLRPFSVKGADLCYNTSASSHELPAIPTITFHFLGGVDLEIPPHSALVAESVSRDRKLLTVCAAFVDEGPYSPDDTNIIGNYQQQNYWIEHDLENSRVGFAKSACLSP